MTAPPTAPPDVRARQLQLRPVVLRHQVQYLGLRSAIAVLRLLDFPSASTIGAELGLLGYWPFGIRRDVVRKQIAAAFPEWDATRVRAVTLAAFEHLGSTVVEAALMSHFTREEILERFDPCDSWPVLEAARRLGKGVVLVAGHLGNWEIAGSYIAARGVPYEVVTRQQENPLFDAYVQRNRTRLGMHVIYDGDAARRVPRALRAEATVAMLIDQGAAGLASYWVPFFGRLAKTPRGVGTFALRLGAPIVFYTTLRRPGGRFSMHFEAVPVTSTGDKTADVEKILADCTVVLERWVRQYPEQYFWHHRRWKHQQPGTPPELGNPL